jgi:glutamate racemase
MPWNQPPTAMKYPFIVYLITVLALFTVTCQNQSQNDTAEEVTISSLPIVRSVLEDTASIYYINSGRYPQHDPSLPIGVFDSGTGGLTVLEAILTADAFNNANHLPGKDMIPDFQGEEFIYLADQANMPYGIYSSESKTALLIEHIIKDAVFLLSDKYYPAEDYKQFTTGKQPVKAIVIACNTATAYGGLHLNSFMKAANLNIRVIGVIDAGARGALELFNKNDGGTIGVLATVGTVASDGYSKAVYRIKEELGYMGDIQVVSRGGHGIAEAIDEEPSFIDINASTLRTIYKGPALTDTIFPIERNLLDIYNFDFTSNRMLCDSDDPETCGELQINDPENYMRYHLVSLMEEIRKKPGSKPLKAIILGCTHYPYLNDAIEAILDELYEIKRDGEYLYRHLMENEVILIDPSVNVATELYQVLQEVSLINKSEMNSNGHEFYISVPNIHNTDTELDSSGRFTYEYKYGREAGSIQEYVKVIPFSGRNISAETLDRLARSTPVSYKAISEFSSSSAKTKHLPEESRIGIR